MMASIILDRLHMAREELTGDFVAAVEAEQFAEQMRAEYPEEWHEWAEAAAVHLLTIELTRHERHARRRALDPARLFSAAADAGDFHELGLYRVTFTVDDVNTRRPFGDMNGADCRYAASNYLHTAKQARMMASFLDAVGKRVKSKTVAEVLTEEQCRRMLRSLGGNGDELSAAA